MIINWLKELPDGVVFGDAEVRLSAEVLEAITSYAGSQPTAPSPGRVYRKPAGNGGQVVFVVREDPNDSNFRLHYPHRAVVTDAAEKQGDSA